MAKKKKNKKKSKKKHKDSKKKKTKKKAKKDEIAVKFDSEKLFQGLIVVLSIALLFNFYSIYQTTQEIEEKRAVEAEKKRPADINIFTLYDPACDNCLDISSVVSQLKEKNVNVISENEYPYTSEQGEEIVNKYDIKFIPALVVEGEVSKNSDVKSFLNQLGEINEDNTFSMTEIVPPYTDASTGEIKGLVEVTHIYKEDCPNCTKLEDTVSGLSSLGIVVSERNDIKFENAGALIEKYNITKIPSLVFSEELSAYETFLSQSQASLSEEEDGSYVLREVSPPYYSTEEGEMVGLVSIKYLTTPDCDECSNAHDHDNLLGGTYGLALESEGDFPYDSGEGKALVEKYNIIKVPTVILSEDAGYYTRLMGVWSPVGSQEEDGSYVFRDPSVMNGAYINVETGEIVS